MNIQWPNGKDFAFTIFDDTDHDHIDNTKPVYDLLDNCGLYSTKSAWVYPPRDSFSGLSLQDKQYQEYILNLQNRGFEIALHNVGSGEFSRKEIIDGVEEFRNIVGSYPTIQVNHSSNPDNIYWMSSRFLSPVSDVYSLIKLLNGERRYSEGHQRESERFWADIVSKHMKYVRNFTFNGVNTLKYDPKMPWHDPDKPFVPYWFSSSDGKTVREFSELISPDNVDKLQRDGGLCIVYTHFASGFYEGGKLDSLFSRRIKNLSNRNGWFAPVSEILDWLLEEQSAPQYFTKKYGLRLNLLWLMDKISSMISHRNRK